MDVLLLAPTYPLLLLFNGAGQNLYLLVLAVLPIAVLLLRLVPGSAEAGARLAVRATAALMAGGRLGLAAGWGWRPPPCGAPGRISAPCMSGASTPCRGGFCSGP